MANSLPSYAEAVSGGHWLDLVAPYVAIQDYSKLCRVSRRFYDQFAPRLWSDPLQSIRRLGLHPNDDLAWFTHLVTVRAKHVRNSTRKLVLALDLGISDTDTPSSIISTNLQEFAAALRLIGVAFPAVRCILLQGNTGYDLSDLGRLPKPEEYPDDGSVSMPLVLDIGCCGMPVPRSFFHTSYWRHLVYLDISGVHGSLQGNIRAGTFYHSVLPALRVLKICNRELDDASLASLAKFTCRRLWSMDLSQNRLTDSCVRNALHQCFGTDELTVQGGCYEVEGKLAVVQDRAGAAIPQMWRGWFSYVVESDQSATFSHPDRYLADSPLYDESSQTVRRLAGNEPLRSDRVEDFKRILAGSPGQLPPDWLDAQNADICQLPQSLTHLHLGENPSFTVEGVESVFRFSRGHIRHFDCASPAMATGGQVPFALAGIVGRSHLFRPVLASNLQSLRIHHSLVTQIPTLHDPRKSALVALDYAETVLRARAEMAYPLAFVPDLNPRLQSLTLTCLPRVSRAPLIDKLKQFLLAAADQENALGAQRAAFPMSRRGPTMVRGLRHIRLEFEPETPLDTNLDGPFESLDAQGLLDASAEDFSFFAGKSPAALPDAENMQMRNGDSGVARPFPPADASLSGSSSASDVVGKAKARQSDRLPYYPLPGALDADSEYVCERLLLHEPDHASDGVAIRVSVWVGSGRRGTNQALNAYMANLSRESLRSHIRPATPDQVKVGVPEGACVYNAAWDAILWLVGEPDDDGESSSMTKDAVSLAEQPSMAPGQLASQLQSPHGQMHNVVDAIRQFRAETRAACRPRGLSPTSPASSASFKNKEPQCQQQKLGSRYWTGTLEVLLAP
ncbi:hypothetical protein SEPCBS119000_005277 [Sporothrix epigloea]|uniref:Leucine rich repeat domain containing protein n=1 Tax=Sporothrix epigloea TaxID=1892477 RepID=A0ABP0DWR1_9PEZI